VCVHCRHEARIAARERRRRLLLRACAGAIVVATFLAVGVLSATALRSRAGRDSSRTRGVEHAAGSVQPITPAPTQPDSVAQQGAAPPAASVATQAAASGLPAAATQPSGGPTTAAPTSATTPATTSAPTKGPTPPFGPVIDQGESPIAPGVYAIRTDSAVSVFFDNPERRTRVPEKFEAFVRETLPKIFGSAADSALAKLPVGAMASQGNLLTDLPIRGVRIPVNASWVLTVYPSTRPGRDGPLIIRYQAAVMRAKQ
jgi:hypothetical protein